MKIMLVRGGGKLPLEPVNYGLNMGFALLNYTCHLACDAIKRWGHMVNFHWATNLSVMTKVP
jgi:hypothetical protein